MSIYDNMSEGGKKMDKIIIASAVVSAVSVGVLPLQFL